MRVLWSRVMGRNLFLLTEAESVLGLGGSVADGVGGLVQEGVTLLKVSITVAHIDSPARV